MDLKNTATASSSDGSQGTPPPPAIHIIEKTNLKTTTATSPDDNGQGAPTLAVKEGICKVPIASSDETSQGTPIPASEDRHAPQGTDNVLCCVVGGVHVLLSLHCCTCGKENSMHISF